MNPVVLLDEVDKLSAGGWSGDPTAALLEVLDPAQNHTFRDHYLEIDLDLSDVVFIATANSLDTHPRPAARPHGARPPRRLHRPRRRRSSAERYLLPRQLRLAGLAEADVVVDDATLDAIINGYTREAGRPLARARARQAGPQGRRQGGDRLGGGAGRRRRACSRGSVATRSTTRSPSAPACRVSPPASPSPAPVATCCSSR